MLDGELDLTPNTLNDPFPCTRSGFLKATVLLTAKDGVSHDELSAHWLNVRAPNVAGVMEQVGGFRYVISLSMEPEVDPYVGMAELYFPDSDSLRRYSEIFVSDGIENFHDVDARLLFYSNTEMVGIP